MKFFVSGKFLLTGILLFTATSCKYFSDNMSETKEAASDTRFLKRFSEAEADSLTKKVNGVIASFEKDSGEQPSAKLTQELGAYTIASEIKIFFPTKASPEDAKTKLISLIEKVGNLKNILDQKGKALYKEVESVDKNGQPTPEVVDGNAIPEARRFADVTIGVSGVNAKCILRVSIVDKDNLLKLVISNETDMKVDMGLFTKTAINAGGLIASVELYPYKNGFLAYSTMKMKAADSLAATGMNIKDVIGALSGTMEYIRVSFTKF